ncbi:MAG: nitroreductase/quinone reductase family protein [Haloarculaceae archaeon]
MGTDGAGVRVSGLQRAAEQRVFNPMFRALLRSPLHWPASRWLALLSYEGRHTGRRYTTPVAYARREGVLIVVTPERESIWWHNFASPRDCTVWYRGTARPATGELLEGRERATALREYFEQHRAMGRLLGVRGGRRASTDQFGGIAAVRFRFATSDDHSDDAPHG